MDTDYSTRAPRNSPVSHSTVSSSVPLPTSGQGLNSSLSCVPLSPSGTSTPTVRRLDALLREQALLSSMKSTVPHVWTMLDSEITRLRSFYENQRAPSAPKSIACTRKRIKLRVPAEKYPDYNFVGRLLGPRGATLKKLERDTGCKIMIRGRGSIRKDKESEVRGKPGWEHVFNENLHVVIEVSDFVDDTDANRILTRAREMVELLLVPVPEERDTLKRQQLRDLAILNGTYRSTDPPLAVFQPPARSREFVHANADFDYPPFSASDSFLARRRQVASSGSNLDRSAGPPSTSSLPRHGGPAAMAAAAAAAAAAGGVESEDRFGRSKVKSALPSRSDSYLPDIGSLRIPSLDIETMSESFLVSPMVGGLPGPSPTVVDETFYPFPSTPGVRVHDRCTTTFGSPIWSNAPASSPLNTSAPLGSSPLPSPPARSPPDEGSTAKRIPIPSMMQLGDGESSVGDDGGVPVYSRGRAPAPTPHARTLDAAAALARDLPTRSSVYQALGSESEERHTFEGFFANGSGRSANKTSKK